jgi:hypothetical protein
MAAQRVGAETFMLWSEVIDFITNRDWLFMYWSVMQQQIK